MAGKRINQNQNKKMDGYDCHGIMVTVQQEDL